MGYLHKINQFQKNLQPKEHKMDYEQIPEGEITEKQTKEVVGRMSDISKKLGFNLPTLKESWWRRIKKRLK